MTGLKNGEQAKEEDELRANDVLNVDGESPSVEEPPKMDANVSKPQNTREPNYGSTRGLFNPTRIASNPMLTRLGLSDLESLTAENFSQQEEFLEM